MGTHVAAMREMQRRGAVAFDYGNNIRAQAVKAGVEDAFEIKGFIPSTFARRFARARAPFRWAALSGDPEDIAVTDAAILELFPDNARCAAGSSQAGSRWLGLPCRICWLGYDERERPASSSTISCARAR